MFFLYYIKARSVGLLNCTEEEKDAVQEEGQLGVKGRLCTRGQ